MTRHTYKYIIAILLFALLGIKVTAQETTTQAQPTWHTCGGCFNFSCDSLSCDLPFSIPECDFDGVGAGIVEVPDTGGIPDTIIFYNLDSVPVTDGFIQTTINLYSGAGDFADAIHTVSMTELGDSVFVANGDGGIEFGDDLVVEYYITTMNCHGKKCVFSIDFVDPCEALVCTNDSICVDGACVDPCDTVVCAEGEFCLIGECLLPCDTVVCGIDSICEAGVCIDTTACTSCMPFVLDHLNGNDTLVANNDTFQLQCDLEYYIGIADCNGLQTEIIKAGFCNELGECSPIEVSPSGLIVVIPAANDVGIYEFTIITDLCGETVFWLEVVCPQPLSCCPDEPLRVQVEYGLSPSIAASYDEADGILNYSVTVGVIPATITIVDSTVIQLCDLNGNVLQKTVDATTQSGVVTGIGLITPPNTPYILKGDIYTNNGDVVEIDAVIYPDILGTGEMLITNTFNWNEFPSFVFGRVCDLNVESTITNQVANALSSTITNYTPSVNGVPIPYIPVFSPITTEGPFDYSSTSSINPLSYLFFESEAILELEFEGTTHNIQLKDDILIEFFCAE